MLKAIEFIKNNENWRDLIQLEPYFIKIDEEQNYVCLSYSQIESDFSQELVRECRGLIIDKNTLEPVALSFYKFFNVQEQWADKINWSFCRVQEKIDGSKILIWFDKYSNRWRISTSSKLDASILDIQGTGITFQDLVYKVLNDKFEDVNYFWDYCLDKSKCYTFELVSPESRVVIQYKDTNMFLIGVRDIQTFEERVPATEVELCKYFERPKQYPLTSLKACLEATDKMGFDEEGFVVVDLDWNRVKIKSPAYVAAHYLRNNGVQSRKRILELIERNEQSEFLSYFPEYKDIVDEVKGAKDKFMQELIIALSDIFGKKIAHIFTGWTRKDFALYINEHYPKLQGFLFRLLDADLIKLFAESQFKQLQVNKKLELIGIKEVEEELEEN